MTTVLCITYIENMLRFHKIVEGYDFCFYLTYIFKHNICCVETWFEIILYIETRRHNITNLRKCPHMSRMACRRGLGSASTLCTRCAFTPRMLARHATPPRRVSNMQSTLLQHEIQVVRVVLTCELILFPVFTIMSSPKRLFRQICDSYKKSLLTYILFLHICCVENETYFLKK